ncbi:MAG: DsbA family oxidoreductase [Pseudomonadota bacterium]
MIKLDIISDPICPWCYIGKTNLDRALAKFETPPFITEWHPFQLNPDMPMEGMDRREYLETKFGGKDAAVKVYASIDQAAKDVGLDLNLGGIDRTPNTIDAHRLIHWAGLEGKQNNVVDRLFAAYFHEARDISKASVLVRIAAAAGMDGDSVRNLLDGEDDKDDLRKRDAHARERGVGGVPCFIVDNHYAVQGAQSADVWANIVTEISEKTA